MNWNQRDWNVGTQSKVCPWNCGKIAKYKLLVVNGLKPAVLWYSIPPLSIPPDHVYTLPVYSKHEETFCLSSFPCNETWCAAQYLGECNTIRNRVVRKRNIFLPWELYEFSYKFGDKTNWLLWILSQVLVGLSMITRFCCASFPSLLNPKYLSVSQHMTGYFKP